MASTWKTVRIFISSTFSDMHAERDHLVKVVFPALRERLERYRVHLVDVDLRWGVTKDQVENDEVLDICLDQIDACRPFFVGILGERYGWIPRKVPDRVTSKYDRISHHSDKSITELEILHSVLNNLDMHRHAFFFFRDPAIIRNVPTWKSADVEAESPEHAGKLAALKQAIRDARLPVPRLENYPCQYAGLRINWRLARMELSNADRQALESVAADELITPDQYESLNERHREIVHRYGTVRLLGLENFGRQVEQRLWTSIKSAGTEMGDVAGLFRLEKILQPSRPH